MLTCWFQFCWTTFYGCFDLGPWHLPVGGSTIMANPLLDGSQLSSRRCHIRQDGLSAASLSLLFAVLYALPNSPNLVSSLHTVCAGHPLHRPLRETAKRTIVHPCSFPTSLRIWGSPFHVPHYNFLLMTRSALRRLFSTMSGTNFLSRSTPIFQSFPISYISCCFNLSHKLYLFSIHV